MVEENKNKKKFFLKKRRYFGILLFLGFALGILNFNFLEKNSSNSILSEKALAQNTQTSAQPQQSDGIFMNLLGSYARTVVTSNPIGMGIYRGVGSGASLFNWAMGAVTGTTGTDFVKNKLATAAGSAALLVFNYLLYAVFWVVSKLLIAAGFILDKSVDAEIFRRILNSGAVVEGWRMIRDFCNLAFILVLLFSAFCTIFQVDKWNLKKILVTLVIIALLVNFSFPISRFIIDFSNVTMFYILRTVFPVNSQAGSISAYFTGITQITEVMTQQSIDSSWGVTAQLIMMIIFVFILMATMMVTALTLLVRVVILAVLVIFSAGGLAATIFPSTQNISKQWWENLFKYSFIGPILVFFMYFAIKLMQFATVDKANSSSFFNTNMTVSDRFGPTAFLFAIPVAVLWIGLSMSSKMGAIGASYATSKLTQMGKWAARQPWKGIKAGVRATGVSGGAKQGWDNFTKTGKLFGRKIPLYGGKNARERREAQFGGAISYGARGWTAGANAIDRKRAREQADEYKKLNKSGRDAATDLATANASGNRVDAMANSIYMMEQGLLDDVRKFSEALRAFSGDKDMQSKIISKGEKNIISNAASYKTVRDIVSATDPSLVKALDRKMTDEGQAKAMINYDITLAPVGSRKTATAAYTDRLGKLSPQDFAKQKNLNPIGTPGNRDYSRGYQAYLSTLKADDRQNVARYLSSTDRNNWRGAGLL